MIRSHQSINQSIVCLVSCQTQRYITSRDLIRRLLASSCLPRPSATYRSCEAEEVHHDMRCDAIVFVLPPGPPNQNLRQKGKGTCFPRHVHFWLFVFGGVRAIAKFDQPKLCKAKANGVRPRRHPSQHRTIPLSLVGARARELEREQASGAKEHNRSSIPAAAAHQDGFTAGPFSLWIDSRGRPKPLGSSPRGLEGV